MTLEPQYSHCVPFKHILGPSLSIFMALPQHVSITSAQSSTIKFLKETQAIQHLPWKLCFSLPNTPTPPPCLLPNTPASPPSLPCLLPNTPESPHTCSQTHPYLPILATSASICFGICTLLETLFLLPGTSFGLSQLLSVSLEIVVCACLWRTSLEGKLLVTCSCS